MFENDPELDSRAKNVFAKLSLIKTQPEPPKGLVDRTLSRLQEVIPSSVYQSLNTADQPVLMGRRRADLLIAASIGFVVFLLGLTFVQRLRNDAAVAQCQNTLRSMHLSLTHYADTHNGHYPSVNKAGDFVYELERSGHSVQPKGCPTLKSTNAEEIQQVGYTYTLGFRSQGQLIGFRRPDSTFPDSDMMPLVADFPASSIAPSIGSYSPHGKGQNVLFAGGYVRYTTSANVGVNGDDIFRNHAGVVAAGLTNDDVCLGRPGDRP